MKFPEYFRVKKGRFGSSKNAPEGLFIVKLKGAKNRAIERPVLRIIASAACKDFPWDHVSVSLDYRCPTWEEMCIVKDLFWDEEEPVMQYHAAKSQWVNNHQYCLHLWKPVLETIPAPPPILVGVKSLGTLE